MVVDADVAGGMDDCATAAAAAFSCTRSIRLIPGIGAICEYWASNQVRAIWPAIAPSRSAKLLTWSTNAWLAVRLSEVNRGMVLRTSPVKDVVG